MGNSYGRSTFHMFAQKVKLEWSEIIDCLIYAVYASKWVLSNNVFMIYNNHFRIYFIIYAVLKNMDTIFPTVTNVYVLPFLNNIISFQD